VSSSCKPCHSEYNKEYRRKHREALLEADRRRYWENRDHFLAYAADYRSKNKEVMAERQRDYYRRKKHEFLARNSKRRKTVLKATPNGLSKESLKEIDEIYAVAQRLRSAVGIDFHVDHIVPLNNPTVCGLHVPWNLQVIPAKENLRKGNSFIQE